MTTLPPKEFKGKAIYNPSGAAREYSYWACNFYAGCSNNCDYCYCKNGFMSKTWSTTPRLKKFNGNPLDIFKAELLQNLSEVKKHGLFFSFTTDPLLPETKDLTFGAILICQVYNVPVKILTKTGYDTAVWLNRQCEAYNLNKRLIAYGNTLTGHDEKEPFAAPNDDRVKGMEYMHKADFRTFASMEPVIDFKTTFHYIQETLYFCDYYKIGLLSGGTYNGKEAINFMEYLLAIPERPVIYCKQSLKDLLGWWPERHYTMFVSRGYNMFKD